MVAYELELAKLSYCDLFDFLARSFSNYLNIQQKQDYFKQIFDILNEKLIMKFKKIRSRKLDQQQSLRKLGEND